MFGLRSLKTSTVFVLVTVLTLITSIINFIGKKNIKSKAYQWYANSSLASADYAKVRDLKKQLVQLNRERNSISAQDNYAKWIKMNRKYDQLDAEIKEQEKLLAKNQVGLDAKIDKVINLLTTMPMYLIRLWYSRLPLIYLPYGLFPAILETFVLNIPFLPRGSIGVVVWTWCLSKVLDYIFSLGKFLFTKAPAAPTAPAAPGSTAVANKTD